MRPLVGIPPCLDDRGRWRRGRRYQYLDAAYTVAVAAAGGAAVWLPLQAEPETLLDRLDGLLLPGGDDFPPPARYPHRARFEPVPEAQLAFDTALLTGALERGLPVLAICYGMQLLALHHGGALVYDIPSECPGASDHRLPEPDGRHPLELEPGTRLAAALDAEPRPIAVNSLHHQAVADPGRGLRVSARAEDGLIEALERPDGPFCLGVQWHPEKMEPEHAQRLLGAFVAACVR